MNAQILQYVVGEHVQILMDRTSVIVNQVTFNLTFIHMLLYLGYSGDNFCTDTDECDGENVCLFDQKCENTDGSYYCACFEGYERDVPNDQQAAANCIDVDECVDYSCPGELL